MANSVFYTYVGEAANKVFEVGLVEEAKKLRAFIAERQELRKREQAESNEGRRMIEEIQTQQKEARRLRYKAETRTRKKPPPSRRQLNRKAQKSGPVTTQKTRVNIQERKALNKVKKVTGVVI